MFSSAAFTGSVEFAGSFSKRPGLTHILFDFDGTLSWIRHGWPEIMRELFRAHFPARPGESESAIRDLLIDGILGLNGKPTIHQTIWFTEFVAGRGGLRLDAESLRQEYQRRLDAEIETRSRAIRAGQARPDDYVVFGARRLLERIKELGLTPMILSSTIEHRVREEARILEIEGFFGRHIHGSGADPNQFSKMEVIQRLLRSEGISGENLLSFGDGPVEIRNTREVGGLAIAVASDENKNGSGVMDPWKRRQLLEAGADAAIADYRDAVQLLDLILGH
jgi:phosphoglycolate phosphatase-like HAD superfamily hydrolase